MPGLADVAGAGDGQLEGVDVQPLLVSVGEEADEVVLLQALRVVLVVDVGARRAGIPLFKWTSKKQIGGTRS